MRKCTFLVNSCDVNEDIWLPFFMCLEKNWPEMNWPVVLNTESKSFQFGKYKIDSYGLFKNRRDKWSQRLKETLQKIKTEYVFFILDDFFIVKPVQHEFISQCFDWLDQNPQIAVFSFHPVVDGNNEKSRQFKGFEKRPLRGDYKLNCQAAIWRRERLIEFLKDDESPWEFEMYGSIRMSAFDDDFYVLSQDQTPPMDYNMRKNGTGLVRGKWSRGVVVPLFKELGLEIDFSKRGFIEEDYFDVDRRTFWQKVRDYLKRRRKLLSAKIWAWNYKRTRNDF